jgi:uncharacterized membrane protein YccC
VGRANNHAALLNVYLQVYLAHRDLRFPLLLGAAAIAQVVVVAFWHSGPRDIVLATLACCAVTLVIHELAFPYRIARLWAARGRR